MSVEDKSSSGRIRMIKARTLATFYATNPPINEFGGSAKPSSHLTQLLRNVGTYYDPCDFCTSTCIPVCDIDQAFMFPFEVNDISALEAEIETIVGGQTITIPPPPTGYAIDNLLFVFFPNVCNAINFQFQLKLNSQNVPHVAHNLGGPFETANYIFPSTNFYVIYPSIHVSENEFELTVEATNECSSSSTQAQFGCFMKGSPVHLADGSTKPIEDIHVGDIVIGAFGEHNPVLALHRPLLGASHVAKINNEHTTTTHHPHVSAASEHKFYCIDPKRISSFTYGKQHTVILADGHKELRTMIGLASDRIHTLEIGVRLQTISGSRAVTSIEKIPMSPFTQVYHLVVGGSHTYIVEGYAVTAWPREDDFDYDLWSVRATD